MKRIGITGQSGFIGTHLARYVDMREDTELVPFEDSFFFDEAKLRAFVRQCDVVVHLAAMSRSQSEEELYNTNVGLVRQVVWAMEIEQVTPLVMFSSSTHETRDTAYGRAKLEGGKIFAEWAKRSGASFVGFVFPNVYGPGAKVHYASFVANFAWEIHHGVEPRVMIDSLLPLKYVESLCEFIGLYIYSEGVCKTVVPEDFMAKVTDILSIFRMFAILDEETVKKVIAAENNITNLYNTYMSYK